MNPPPNRPEPPLADLHSPEDLLAAGLIKESDLPAQKKLAEKYAVGIPKAFRRLFSGPAASDPIALQVLPDPRELELRDYELEDPISDAPFSPLPGLIHRYPNRVLLKPLLVCPLYCRFCFRRAQVGQTPQTGGVGILSETQITEILDYLNRHPEISEAILSGGDPLMLSPRRLGSLLERLAGIPHIASLRIHTRVPVAAPDRLDKKMLEALTLEKPLFLAVHVNHPKELGQQARKKLSLLRRRGVQLLSQSVLLKGVNDDVQTLESLFQTLLQSGIRPYYLHHLDPAPGTAHFHVPVERGLALLKSLRGKISGLAWPLYVVDLPGGKGKVPLGPAYFQEEGKTGNDGVQTALDSKGDLTAFR